MCLTTITIKWVFSNITSKTDISTTYFFHQPLEFVSGDRKSIKNMILPANLVIFLDLISQAIIYF